MRARCAKRTPNVGFIGFVNLKALQDDIGSQGNKIISIDIRSFSYFRHRRAFSTILFYTQEYIEVKDMWCFYYSACLKRLRFVSCFF